MFAEYTNAVISKATYITLPFIPSPQGRGSIITLSPGGRGRACLSLPTGRQAVGRGEGALLMNSLVTLENDSNNHYCPK